MKNNNEKFTTTNAPSTIINIPVTTPQITFTDDTIAEVGKLTWNEGQFEFEGEANESARIFFDHLIALNCHEYEKIKKENKKLKEENKILQTIHDKVMYMKGNPK